MGSLEDMIKFNADAYGLQHKLRIETKEGLIKETQIIIELKQLSPYVDNLIKIGVTVTGSGLTIQLAESLHDAMMGAHILTSTLHRFVNDADVLVKYMHQIEANKLKISKDNVADFIECLAVDVMTHADSYYKMCPICLKDKLADTMILSPCDNCIPASYSKIYGNLITDMYDKDINQFKLLLYTSLKAIDNKQRFIPVPKYCLSKQYEDTQIGKTEVSRDFSYYIGHISVSQNDKELYQRIKEKEFMFLKHIILSNNTRLNYFDDSKQSVIDKTIDLWAPNDTRSIVFTVQHPADKQAKFDASSDVVHMFHGSSIYNWYSIMRNGLKNYSGTALMSNGQVYGPGIYLADNIGMAMGYCRTGDEHNIIGVVQVLNSSKYKKTDQIYVVPEENDVLLKYLIVIKSKRETSNTIKIQDYLTKELPNTIKESIMGTIGIAMKRLNKEYDELTKRCTKLTKIKIDKTDAKRSYVSDIVIDRSDNVQTEDQSSKAYLRSIRWNLKITLIGKVQKVINVDVIFPKSFPTSSCTIICADSCVQKTPMMEKNNDNLNTYTYTDPMMRYDKWRSDVKIFKILYQMIQNIADYAI